MFTKESILKFGKYKGRPISYILVVEPKYLTWLKSKGHKFDNYLNQII